MNDSHVLRPFPGAEGGTSPRVVQPSCRAETRGVHAEARGLIKSLRPRMTAGLQPCSDHDLNWRHMVLHAIALPTELPRRDLILLGNPRVDRTRNGAMVYTSMSTGAQWSPRSQHESGETTVICLLGAIPKPWLFVDQVANEVRQTVAGLRSWPLRRRTSRPSTEPVNATNSRIEVWDLTTRRSAHVDRSARSQSMALRTMVRRSPVSKIKRPLP